MSAASARTPGAAAWPEQMITQAEAFTLASSWPLQTDWITTPRLEIVLLCGKCKHSMGQLLIERTVYNGTLDEMLSMVLRHMVMAHDVPLAGLRRTEPGPCYGKDCDHVSHGT